MKRCFRVLAATCAMATLAAVVQGGVAAAGVVPPPTRPLPVSRLAAADVTATALRLDWQWPSWAVTSVTIRMGAPEAGRPTTWKAVATVTRKGRGAADSLRVTGLKPLTRYEFAITPGPGTSAYLARAALAVTTAPLRLRVGDASAGGGPSAGGGGTLPDGIRGLYYLDVLTASGGVGPYTWSAAALPAGLSLTPGGVLTGYPAKTGVQPVSVRVRDARGVTARGTLWLAVPASLPSGCVARSCAQVSAGARTVAVPAANLARVTRLGGTGPVLQVVLRRETVRDGDVLVLPAGRLLPSGLIAVADAVTTPERAGTTGAGTAGTTTVAVRAVSPAAAYDRGTVQTAVPTVRALATAGPMAPAASAPAASALACGAGVTSHLHGLGVVPALTPAVAAQWRHSPYAGGGGYAGPAGLRFFQLTLAGTMTVNLGVSVSGKATCALTLPPVTRTEPIGGVGAVRLTLRPALSLVTTGQLDAATSVTLTCYASYRVDAGAHGGTAASGGYCTAADRPLKFSSLSAASATATASIAASAVLDDLPVVTGTITTSLKAAYRRGSPSAATVSATDAYALASPLGSLWAGAPATAAAHGAPFSRVLARLHGLPPAATGTGTAAIAVTPTVAYPWNNSRCGFARPGFGPTTFTVAGSGFLPGEQAAVETDWLASPVRASASPDGSFTVTSPVGEVPSVLDQLFSVGASGNAGSSAAGTIELDADGCLLQRDTAGRLAVQWGGNGFDPDSALSLSVDGVTVGHATTDALGSAGATVTFACPADGRYTWQVTGIVNEAPVDAASSVGCAPGSGYPHGVEIGGTQASAAAATLLGGRQPWRNPPARLLVPAT